MLRDIRSITNDPLMTIENPCLMSGERFRESVCRTRNLVDNFYQCQVNRLDCEHAFTFGMSFLCSSPNRHEYSEYSDVTTCFQETIKGKKGSLA